MNLFLAILLSFFLERCFNWPRPCEKYGVIACYEYPPVEEVEIIVFDRVDINMIPIYGFAPRRGATGTDICGKEETTV